MIVALEVELETLTAEFGRPLLTEALLGTQHIVMSQVRISESGEQLAVCFFVGAIAAVIIAVVALNNSQGKQLNDSFARFARQFRGSFRPGDWSDTPAVSFEHNTSSALLDVTRPPGSRSGWCTQITFAFRRPMPVALEIDPDGIDKPQLRYVRMQPSPVGEASFDACHRVLASDRRVVRELLTPALREDLMRVRESLGANVNIAVSRDYLLIRFPGRIREFPKLLVLAYVAFQLHDQLLLVVNQASPEEVRILEVSGTGVDSETKPNMSVAGSVDSQPATTVQPAMSIPLGAKCGVCGEPVLEDLVLCRCCRAPHHRDCWEYNRNCSVYACREKSYIRPEITPAMLARVTGVQHSGNPASPSGSTSHAESSSALPLTSPVSSVPSHPSHPSNLISTPAGPALTAVMPRDIPRDDGPIPPSTV